MELSNRVYFASSSNMNNIENSSVDLVVTSPPYPMIEMWDRGFCEWNPSVQKALENAKGNTAFGLMHECLDSVWRECARIVKPGGFACINIGDAARTINKNFSLFSNHSKIIQSFTGLGFQSLPLILWRKQTNAPNKFMGAGMLPSGAYVTLEHEYILIFRKGEKRVFGAHEKLKRRQSAFFWEERNQWFSDVWDFKGTRQTLLPGHIRNRSGAFPLELAHRLICMYSLKGDTVVDPFLGTGTTLAAAVLNCRRCTGYEIEPGFEKAVSETVNNSIAAAHQFIASRLEKHKSFIDSYTEKKGSPKYLNEYCNVPVVTKQETDIQLDLPAGSVITRPDAGSVEYSVTYKPFAMN